jgi:hypothetical protein
VIAPGRRWRPCLGPDHLDGRIGALSSYLEVDYSAVELPAVCESVEAPGAISIVPAHVDGSDSAALDAGDVAITFVQGNYDALGDPAVVAEVEALTPVLTGLVG